MSKRNFGEGCIVCVRAYDEPGCNSPVVASTHRRSAELQHRLNDGLEVFWLNGVEQVKYLTIDGLGDGRDRSCTRKRCNWAGAGVVPVEGHDISFLELCQAAGEWASSGMTDSILGKGRSVEGRPVRGDYVDDIVDVCHTSAFGDSMDL